MSNAHIIILCILLFQGSTFQLFCATAGTGNHQLCRGVTRSSKI